MVRDPDEKYFPMCSRAYVQKQTNKQTNTKLRRVLSLSPICRPDVCDNCMGQQIGV